MIVGAVMPRRASGGLRSQRRQAETWRAGAITVTVAAGILTTITKSNWWSYLMALGFITSLLIYGSLLVRASPSPPPAR